MIIEKKTFRLKENERLDSMEIKKEGHIQYYSYNYKIRSDEEWRTLVRWDNFQQQPHVDSFDDNGNLLNSSTTRDKTMKEVLELIDIFGKSIVTMDIREL
ncbi:MAG: DUF6516 family protein [Candidatus Saliniplasma sp.]